MLELDPDVFLVASDGVIFAAFLVCASDFELFALYFAPDYRESRGLVESELRARRLMSAVKRLEAATLPGVPRL